MALESLGKDEHMGPVTPKEQRSQDRSCGVTGVRRSIYTFLELPASSLTACWWGLHFDTGGAKRTKVDPLGPTFYQESNAALNHSKTALNEYSTTILQSTQVQKPTTLPSIIRCDVSLSPRTSGTPRAR